MIEFHKASTNKICENETVAELMQYLDVGLRGQVIGRAVLIKYEPLLLAIACIAAW